MTDPQTPWIEIIEFANCHLLIPSLFRALHISETLFEIKDTLLVEYLTTLYAFNQKRNEKILEQLKSLTALFSHIDVTPVLLKGATALSEEYYEYLGERVMSDIDLWIPKNRLKECIDLLKKEGEYRRVPGTPRSNHHYPRIYSDTSAAALEVHYYILGGEGKTYFSNTLLKAHLHPALGIPGADVIEPTYDLYHIFLHSQYHHQMHENLGLALRDLHHAATLIRKREKEIDWKALETLCQNHGLTQMWQDYLFLLKHLFQAEIPIQIDKYNSHYSQIIGSMEKYRKAVSRKRLIYEMIIQIFSYRHLQRIYNLKSRKEYPFALIKYVAEKSMKLVLSPETRTRLKNTFKNYERLKKFGAR
ncbi:MAG: nucleotidyltransferase family protein [Epsilonproteobacteria bacterium]|nr:nucleotidyltransferase family protein [Campylobacterota bacterium]